jgi:nucleoid DNA-binding protein
MAKTGTNAKAMSKSEVAAALAERVGISKKQASQFMAAQA